MEAHFRIIFSELEKLNATPNKKRKKLKLFSKYQVQINSSCAVYTMLIIVKIMIQNTILGAVDLRDGVAQANLKKEEVFDCSL